jgi:hypothetical protein
MLDFVIATGHLQWYHTADLWRDIRVVIAQALPVCNLFTEPIETATLVEACFPHLRHRINPGSSQHPPCYRTRTQHVAHFGGTGGYVRSAEEMLPRILAFCEQYVPPSRLLQAGRLTVRQMGCPALPGIA